MFNYAHSNAVDVTHVDDHERDVKICISTHRGAINVLFFQSLSPSFSSNIFCSSNNTFKGIEGLNWQSTASMLIT